MATVMRQIESTICDECLKEGEEKHASPYDACLKCGVVYCYDHSKILSKEYTDGIYSYCHRGTYCHNCDKLLSIAVPKDPLHSLYREMERLKEKEKEFYTILKSDELRVREAIGKFKENE